MCLSHTWQSLVKLKYFVSSTTLLPRWCFLAQGILNFEIAQDWKSSYWQYWLQKIVVRAPLSTLYIQSRHRSHWTAILFCILQALSLFCCYKGFRLLVWLVLSDDKNGERWLFSCNLRGDLSNQRYFFKCVFLSFLNIPCKLLLC